MDHTAGGAARRAMDGVAVGAAAAGARATATRNAAAQHWWVGAGANGAATRNAARVGTVRATANDAAVRNAANGTARVGGGAVVNGAAGIAHNAPNGRARAGDGARVTPNGAATRAAVGAPRATANGNATSTDVDGAQRETATRAAVGGA